VIRCQHTAAADRLLCSRIWFGDPPCHRHSPTGHADAATMLSPWQQQGAQRMSVQERRCGYSRQTACCHCLPMPSADDLETTSSHTPNSQQTTCFLTQCIMQSNKQCKHLTLASSKNLLDWKWAPTRKTLPHMAHSHWIQPKTTEHQSLLQVKEGNLSRILGFNLTC